MPPLPTIENEVPVRRYKLRYLVLTLSVLCILIFCVWFVFALKAPTSLQSERTFTITEGQTVRSIANTAHREGFVRSPLLLALALTYFHDPRTLMAGTYTVTNSPDLLTFAALLGEGEITPETITLTIPEGTRVTEIARIVSEALPSISESEFVEKALPREGYLFPETYHVPPDFTAADLIALMEQTREEQLAPLAPLIAESTLSEYEILTLASLLEREANDEESMRMVSGILQNRLAITMPLQADASIEYVLDKPLSELTPADLDRDTPYNTYTNYGLPPTPIGNPGLTAIRAVLEPIQSEYLFYITGNDGVFYYAHTYDEHRRNIDQYLR